VFRQWVSALGAFGASETSGRAGPAGEQSRSPNALLRVGACAPVRLTRPELIGGSVRPFRNEH